LTRFYPFTPTFAGTPAPGHLRWGARANRQLSLRVIERSRIVAGAQAILDVGGWCVLEYCVSIPEQVWEPALLIFDRVAEAVADAVLAELAAEPAQDARLTGCCRRTLQPDETMGAYLCYVAGIREPAAREW
jgi:hypothetical protein